jgi:hypothetical protein
MKTAYAITSAPALAVEHRRSATGLSRIRAASVAAVTLAVAVLWLLRLSGPIDLRYDAGVYYVLGTSLAQGEGYRIISEPGRPEGIQYPPALPALVAVHQRLLGTSDIKVVAPALRLTYAGMFLVYALAVLALARAFLRPWPALFATLACLGQVNTTLYSDMLFTELPFALVSVALVLTLMTRRLDRWPALRETLAFLLAATGFLLRAAGLALLAAWVGEALLARRWRLAGLRAALALVPFLGWQAHVHRVHASPNYAHPAYAYQRAAYQYYNVTYAENLGLADPFKPELGPTTVAVLRDRVMANLAILVPALGEAVSESNGFWRNTFRVYEDKHTHRTTWAMRVMTVPLLLLAGLVGAGWCVLVRRRAWAFVVLVPVSIGLVCVTPWPQQFARYLTPLVPFLTTAALIGVVWMARRLRPTRFARWRYGVYVLVAVAAVVQLHAVETIFRQRHYEPATYVAGRGLDAPRLFYFDAPWADWEKAMRWVGRTAARDDVVVTASPHLLYLETGLRAVMPPMERDPARALRLLDTVPARWVIVDDLQYLDMSRRYALPAVESDPSRWQLAKQIGTTRVYRRIGGTAAPREGAAP